MTQNKEPRNAFDRKFVKGVSAWGLVWDGQEAGKIVADTGGIICTCTVMFFRGPLHDWQGARQHTGEAGGAQYDKFGTAFKIAVKKFPNLPPGINIPDERDAIENWLKEYNYLVLRVIA